MRVFAPAILLSVLVCSCSASAVLVHGDDYWIERARNYAIEHCVSFWDGSSGEYYIESRGDSVLYVGSENLDSFSAETRVLMNKHGKVLSVDNGGYRVFPDAYPEIRVQRCCNYRKSHDKNGIAHKYIDPYSDCQR